MNRFLSLCVISGFCFAMSAGSSAQDTTKKIKHVPAGQTSAASGEEMYVSYCASCHGKDGKGDGPAAAALKKAPADLTALAKSNGGKYPSMKVTSVLRGEATVSAHGTQRCRSGDRCSGT